MSCLSTQKISCAQSELLKLLQKHIRLKAGEQTSYCCS